MEGKDWDRVSAECKDILQRMLLVDPDERATIQEVLVEKFNKTLFLAVFLTMKIF